MHVTPVQSNEFGTGQPIKRWWVLSWLSSVISDRAQCFFHSTQTFFSLAERLSVTLFGKISQKPMALGKGAIIFPMITRNTDGWVVMTCTEQTRINPMSLCFHSEFYTIHNIFAPISSLKNAPVDRLTEGARVYVSGVIRYLDFHNAEGRLKQQGQILSSSVLLCEQSENPSNGNLE